MSASSYLNQQPRSLKQALMDRYNAALERKDKNHCAYILALAYLAGINLYS